jgi:DsbC/DsbD-like thiol-disulfide interchange protein
MHRTLFSILSILLLIACAGCGGAKAPAGAANNNNSSNQAASEATAKTPPADLVRADAQAVEIAPGGAADASVRLTIANGYHITANPATLSYQIATQLSVEPDNALKAGQPVYPPSVMQKFAFEPKPFAVYEGEAVIRLPLRAEKNASAGAHPLRVKLRVQACDDQSCYPPRTLNTSIPVNIK